MTTPSLVITAVAARPHEVIEVTLTLPEHATVADAVCALQAMPEFFGIDLRYVGVHGEVALPNRRLDAFDRLECYRPLLIDPAAARRARGRLGTTKVGRQTSR